MHRSPMWLLIVAWVGSAGAGEAQFDNLMNINIALAPGSYSGCDFDDEETATCENLASTVDPGDYVFGWIVASREGGVDGLQGDGGRGVGAIIWGIEYDDEVQLGGWSLCTGGSEIPQDFWPQSGTSNAATWSGGCYSTPSEVAHVGFFTITGSGGVIRVMPPTPILGDQPCEGHAVFGACHDEELGCICAANLGASVVGIGTIPTCGDACDAVPSAKSSWGRLKNLF